VLWINFLLFIGAMSSCSGRSPMPHRTAASARRFGHVRPDAVGTSMIAFSAGSIGPSWGRGTVPLWPAPGAGHGPCGRCPLETAQLRAMSRRERSVFPSLLPRSAHFAYPGGAPVRPKAFDLTIPPARRSPSSTKRRRKTPLAKLLCGVYTRHRAAHPRSRQNRPARVRDLASWRSPWRR